MINREDVIEYCRECDQMVMIIQKSHMDYIEWVCAECGSVVDSYVEEDWDEDC